MDHKRLSVVVPTLNCRDMLEKHVATMGHWWHLADEIVVVDSFSEDGTADYARENIRHPGLRVISHPRGLYQSWNQGISQTSGRWVYVSTVGDSITPAQLQRLMELGEEREADVVVSPPRFVDMEDKEVAEMGWPIEQMIKEFDLKSPVTLSPIAHFLLALKYCPMAVLGSSASNVYRGDFLRARPFPTNYGVAGDTGWSLIHLWDTKICLTPEPGSTFRIHPKVYKPTTVERMMELNTDLRAMLWGEYANKRLSITGIDNEGIYRHYQLPPLVREAKDAYRASMRASAVPWFLRAEAWRLRKAKQLLVKEQQALARHVAALLAAEMALCVADSAKKAAVVRGA